MAALCGTYTADLIKTQEKNMPVELKITIIEHEDGKMTTAIDATCIGTIKEAQMAKIYSTVIMKAAQWINERFGDGEGEVRKDIIQIKPIGRG
jgi:hypothetical protein